MTRISKLILILLAAFLFLTEGSFAAMDSNAFEVVPAGDPTYGQLRQLENGGLLPAGASNRPLTRFDVAQKVWDAQQKLREIVVAQADMDLVPPPPAEGVPTAAPVASSVIAIPSEPAAQPAPAAAQPAAVQPTPADDRPLWQNPEKIQAAEQALQSLQETYNLELQLVKDQKTDLTDQLSQAEADEYNLWKQVKSINDNPSVSIHGIGRSLGISQQYYGSSGISFGQPAVRDIYSYLDLEPTGSISKEITFDGILRLGSYDLPESFDPTGGGPTSDFFTFRRISTTFSPDFMTATVGDFYESYTPFTLWNRNNLDLVYVPQQVGRWDEVQKYESLFDHEPDWPLRGLRIGTALDWPDSKLLDSFKVSTFANMINNSFNDVAKGSLYYDTTLDQFTGWVWGAQAELKSKKMYMGETSWQATFDDYLVVLDNPWDTQDEGPNSPYSYSSTNPDTWAHQYIISSFKPSLKIGLGRDVYIVLQEENAISTYQDNILNSKTQTSDWASNIEPYLQMGDSKITVHYIDVGPYFYSPMAQTRQDVNILPGTTADTNYAPGVNGYVPGYALFQTPIQSQFFLQNVPRAGGIFGYYDRTLDNTFPYGLATPNREGVGLDVDIETLKKKSLKIKGSAYLVQEIIGNYVPNIAGTGFTTLDPASNGAAPVRNFTYINFGPSFDLGPNIGLDTPLEIGTNMRYEQTTSVVGTLNSMGIWGEIRVGIVKEWEVDLALGAQSANGTEEGLVVNGIPTPLARYSYVFDNTDLGSYKAFTVNDSVGYYLLSTSFRFDRNSTVYLDYDLSSGNDMANVGQISGTLQNQFIGMTYEVKF